MLGYNQIASKYGYIKLFDCSGAINKDFVAKLDKFFLGKLKHCEATFGDNRKIIEFLEYAETVENGNPKGSLEMQNFDRELATWNK